MAGQSQFLKLLREYDFIFKIKLIEIVCLYTRSGPRFTQETPHTNSRALTMPLDASHLYTIPGSLLKLLRSATRSNHNRTGKL